MNRLLNLSIVFIVTVTLFSGCKFLEGIKHKTANPANPLKQIAVLPLQNDTTDVDAPAFVRNKLIESLQNKQYNVKPIETVDPLLRDRLGVTLGGQLKLASPKKLKEVLDVDGVIMGTLMDFSETTTGVYNVRKVRGQFRMVNCHTGETFWRNGIGVKSHDSTSDLAGTATAFADELNDNSDKEVPWVTMESKTSEYDAAENFALGIGKKLFSKATNSFLEAETEEMIRRATETLPAGPGM